MDNGLIFGLIAALILVPLYLAPAFIAARRKCKSSAGIVVLDLLLGWTLLGWVIAMVWAVSGEVTQAKSSAAA
jgi:uncharacterized RDD family membrane protein YckC